MILLKVLVYVYGGFMWEGKIDDIERVDSIIIHSNDSIRLINNDKLLMKEIYDKYSNTPIVPKEILSKTIIEEIPKYFLGCEIYLK